MGYIDDNNNIRITALSMIVLFEFNWPNNTISYSYSQSFICLGNLFHYTTAGYASKVLHFICQCLIFLQNWSWLAACAGRTYIHWFAVSVLQRSIIFVGLLSAIILFGSAHLFIHWTNNLCKSFGRNWKISGWTVGRHFIIFNHFITKQYLINYISSQPKVHVQRI